MQGSKRYILHTLVPNIITELQNETCIGRAEKHSILCDGQDPV